MADTNRFELFSFWRTSATYRVRVAFNLKGVQPKEHNVNLDAGEQLAEAIVQINSANLKPAPFATVKRPPLPTFASSASSLSCACSRSTWTAFPTCCASWPTAKNLTRLPKPIRPVRPVHRPLDPH